MAGVPNNFIATSEPAVASYDWYDLSTSVGYKRFYAAASTKSGPTYNYFLITQILDSVPAGDSHVAQTEFNFDMLFKRPAIIKGKVFVNLTQGITATHWVYSTVKLYHVSAAAVETEIGTATTVTRTAGGALDYWRECLSFDVTQTHFKIGESFRLSVLSVGDGTGSAYLLFDPNGATVTGATNTVSSSLFIDLPFKVDL